MSKSEKIVFEPSKTTHWKNLFPQKMMLLGSQNLNEGEELIAEISGVSVETIKDQAGKEEQVPVVTFTNAPPMVVNITNAKTISALYGENYDGWIGNSIQIYVVTVKAFGSMTSALRIREAKPDVDINTDQYEQLLKDCSTLDELKAAYTSIPKHIRAKLAQLKDEMKEILSEN